MKNSKKILAVLVAVLMMVAAMPLSVFAADGDVAAVGGETFSTLAEAISAANAGDTVEILAAGTYTLPAIPKNITVKGDVDGVVFNCVGSGSICSVPNGVTFENVKFVMGTSNYHGFQHAGTINMKDCTIDGLFFSYGDMNFDGCTFIQTTTDYMMWAYSGNLTYTNCTFNGNGKFVNVYNEGNDGGTPWNITATGCTFNSSKVNKAAFNVKATCGTKPLKYDVSVSGCTANENFPAASDNGTLVVLNPFIQVDDIKETVDSDITVTYETTKVYPEETATAVAKIGDTEYTDLQAALNAAVATNTDVVVEILCDIDLTGTDWTPVALSTKKSFVTIEGNEHVITGLNDMLFGRAWASKGLVINDLTIKDSNIVNDEADAIGTVGVGAFVGYIDATETVTLSNCHVIDSTVSGGHWAGGLVGICGGYNNPNDGPVFTTLTVDDCSVEGSTVKSKGSVGALIGHASMNLATKVILEGSATNNIIVGASASKTGKLIGTIGAAGGVAYNGENGGIELNVEESGNTGATNVAGRIGTSGGTMTVTGGSYETNPLVTSDNATGTIAPKEGFTVQNNGGKYVLEEEKIAVARIGTETFETLAEAVAAAQNGDTIVMIDDTVIAGNLGVTVPAGLTVTLDLNGKTVSLNATDAAASYLIRNQGDLTIEDSVGGGQLEAACTQPDNATQKYANNVISNYGKLTVNAGRIENKTKGNAAYPVDNYSGGEVVMNGGYLYNYYTYALRMFVASTTADNKVTINGGTVDGYGAMWLQNANSNANKANLTINGGTFKTTEKAVVEGTVPVYDANSYMQLETGYYTSGNDNASVTITGGTFDVNVIAYVSKTNRSTGNLSITGGTFNGYIYSNSDNAFITGGDYLDFSYVDGGETYENVDDVAWYVPDDMEIVYKNEDYFTVVPKTVVDDLMIGTQTKGNETRLIMKLCADAETIAAYESVGFKVVVDGVETVLNVDCVYDSFYNDGVLVTASKLNCTYVAILEIGNINNATSVAVQGFCLTADGVQHNGAVRTLK